MTLRHDDLRAFAEGRFQAQFATYYPLIPVQFADATFKQPVDAPWVRFMIVPAKSFPASMGKTFFERTPGYLEIQVFVPEKQGPAEAKRVAEQSAQIFEYAHFTTASGYVNFREVMAPLDLGTNGGFCRYASRVFFEYDVRLTRPN